MDTQRVTALGAGSMRSGPMTMATLAGYFGERRLEIVLWDADAERLDIVDRLGRRMFEMEQAEHWLRFTEDPAEALADAEWVIFEVGRNCARRRGEDISETVARLAELVPSEARTLNLMPDPYDVPLAQVARGTPFPRPSERERAALPLQILRWLNQEEWPFELLQAGVDSDLRRWLDSPGSIPLQRR